ncbi:hypothetical protein HanIR_Chr10g0477801 [Helianthus annuus]|nr:hypothetical protein HanIR_Chr10g0477801 [Helianthus annuus]
MQHRPALPKNNFLKRSIAQCQVNPNIPDWTCNTGASDHMLPNTNGVTNPSPTQGNKHVFSGNGQSLPISHTGNSKILGSLDLNNILVVPQLTKNMISVSKLTMDNPVDFVFSHPYFLHFGLSKKAGPSPRLP